ncbi:MAG TPA: type II toxin-antitoxin system VapC family toxin [Solirubrobacterales bacterium]|jgi:uncharacterized protein with PIN domain|nr:type II toxin-antitoxin system VapC family toxin [Solirubrobacterales bacterium]
MILDTSAVVAVVRREPGVDRLFEKMTAADRLAIGAPKKLVHSHSSTGTR